MEFTEIFNLLQNIHETDRIEAKAATHGIGKSFLETVCAFSNEPGLGGGYILLGVTEKQEDHEKPFIVTGIKNSDQIQQEIASQCRLVFNVPIRPIIKVVPYQSKNVILVFIEEESSHEKPVYFAKLGMEKGAYRRIGSTDQVCTREDLDFLFQLRSQKKYDELPEERASIEDFDTNAIQIYRKMREKIYKDARELEYSDKDLLKSLNAICTEKGGEYPTVAGILLFGSQLTLERIFPLRNRSDYILIEGREWISNPERQYTVIEICEPLITGIPRLLGQIMTDIPQRFALSSDGLRRKDNPSIPRNVIREAVVNALMHRDYRIPSPVQIIKYANRIEFRNSGYSLKPHEELGLPGSVPRNENIAKVFHNVQFAEEKGSGIRNMREEMNRANLSVPLIESNRSSNTFVLTLLSHHLFDQKDIDWLKRLKNYNLSDEDARTLIVLREMGAITNGDYRTIHGVDTLKASSHLRKLRDLGLLEQKGRGNTTYYAPSQMLLNTEIEPKQEELTPHIEAQPGELAPHIEAQPGESNRKIPSSEKSQNELLSDFPEKLCRKIAKLKGKVCLTELQSIVGELCINKTLNANQIASILGRNPRYIREFILKPMIAAKTIQLRFPNRPNHPQQAYLVARNKEE